MSTLKQAMLSIHLSHSPIHHTVMAEATMQGVHQEQFGVQHLAQGYFNRHPEESGIQTSDLPITG